MDRNSAFPGHVYIPGQTRRHAEGAFDHIRKTAQQGMSPDALARSDAFQIGLQFIEAEYYWEAHEVLEPVWMALEEESDERRFVQGIIQLANGLLKIRMNRPKAAYRLSHIARDLVNSTGCEAIMGLNRATIIKQIDELEREGFMLYNA